MHCPESISGSDYVGLVAVFAIFFCENLNPREIYIFAEFLQAVSNQMLTIGAIKEFQKHPE